MSKPRVTITLGRSGGQVVRGKEIDQAMPTHILELMEANGPGKKDIGVTPMVFGPRTSGSKVMVSIGVVVTLECMIPG